MGKVMLGKEADVPSGSMKKFQVEGQDEIVVANVEGKLFAMRGLCNHAGGPLAEGTLEGKIITCPWHGAKWDVTTGKVAEFAIELDPEPVYPITVENGEIYIEI